MVCIDVLSNKAFPDCLIPSEALMVSITLAPDAGANGDAALGRMSRKQTNCASERLTRFGSSFDRSFISPALQLAVIL